MERMESNVTEWTNCVKKQEEADTLTLLRVGHASPNGHDCIVIKSPDIDVDVLTYI